ncbi:MAG TPA: glycosyltransferase family 9 protein [bacterium]|nr:glycosyltransferase family 9 protein [bacterium]
MISYVRLIYYLLRPNVIFVRRTSNGLGDNLLMTMVLPELKKQHPGSKIVVETPWPELFAHNPYVDWVTTKHLKTTRRHIKARYHVDETTTVSIYEQTMAYVGARRKAEPEIYLTQDEIAGARALCPSPNIVVCPTGERDFFANRKEWGVANFQKVRDLLGDFAFVQVGLPADPLLDGVIDGRHLTIRETAAAIKNSLFFLGLEGGLMHLARSVGSRAVIIYGGLVKPEISAYEENVSVCNPVPCSPCFHSDRRHEPCESMACMKGISPEQVYDMITNRLLPGQRLEV